MSSFNDQQRDADRLRQRADDADRRRTADVQADVVIEYPKRLFVRSPNGTYFSIGVSDAGVLTATNVGTSL